MPPSRLPKGFTPDPKRMPLGVYIAFVKRNDDPQRNGRLSVYVPEFGGDPTDPGSWVLVSYASPFAGATDPTKISTSSQTMEGSQTSYGWWGVPPDLNNEVAVFFANGDISRGYWFACCFQTNMNHMVPGIPVGKTTTTNETAPVVEYNKANVNTTTNPQRPRFDPLADGLLKEGLDSDLERGFSSTSARREAPSKVFGLLSPRGNTMHIDDNTQNEFIRLRTRSGTQIMIDETTGFVYINSKLGNSWLEISDAGIDVYTSCSTSIRAQLDFNVRADRDIVFDAGGNIYMRAGSKIGMQAGTEIDQLAGTNILSKAGNDIQAGAGSKWVVSAGANGSIKVGSNFDANAGGTLGLQSGGNMTQLAGGKQIRAGVTIFDNCGGAPGAPASNAATPTTKQPSNRNDAKQQFGSGNRTEWQYGGAQVNTIVDRMPAHEPWREHPSSNIPPTPAEPGALNAEGSHGGANGSNG